MKKIVVGFLSCLLFIFLAQVALADTATSSASQDVLQTPVIYELPYPGILPDNPFYPLKALRDRIISFFITDPQKQAEFDLLQADKRLVAGEYLLKEPHPNTQLVSQTVSKGENYFQDAVINISKAKKEGRLVNDFLDKLTKASIKHQQVIYMMSQQSNGQLREDLTQDQSRVADLQNQVTNLKPH